MTSSLWLRNENEAVDATGVFGSSGAFSGLLPPGAIAGGRLPAIACYVSTNAGATWLSVAYVPAFDGEVFCGLTGIGTASQAITMINGEPGWHYYLIAVW